MDKIILERMQFYGYHGAIAEENKLGQRYIVDLTLYLDLSSAGVSDDLNETVNYAELYQSLRHIVEGAPFQLIEALAERIASELLAQYTKINQLTVKVTKPHPPVDIHFEGVSVELHRKRVQSS